MTPPRGHRLHLITIQLTSQPFFLLFYSMMEVITTGAAILWRPHFTRGHMYFASCLRPSISCKTATFSMSCILSPNLCQSQSSCQSLPLSLYIFVSIFISIPVSVPLPLSVETAGQTSCNFWVKSAFCWKYLIFNWHLQSIWYRYITIPHMEPKVTLLGCTCNWFCKFREVCDLLSILQNCEFTGLLDFWGRSVARVKMSGVYCLQLLVAFRHAINNAKMCFLLFSNHPQHNDMRISALWKCFENTLNVYSSMFSLFRFIHDLFLSRFHIITWMLYFLELFRYQLFKARSYSSLFFKY